MKYGREYLESLGYKITVGKNSVRVKGKYENVVFRIKKNKEMKDELGECWDVYDEFQNKRIFFEETPYSYEECVEGCLIYFCNKY